MYSYSLKRKLFVGMSVYKHKAELTHSATIVSEESEIKADEWVGRIYSLILILCVISVLLGRYAT